MKKCLFAPFVLLIHLVSFGQYNNSGSNQLFQTYELQTQLKANTLNIDGTPFITDYWNEGEIVAKSGVTFEKVKIRYDAMSDKLHANKEGKDMIVPKILVDTFQYTDSLSGKKVRFINSQKHSRYLETLLSESNVLVFRSYNKILVKPSKPSGTYGAEERQKDRLKNEYQFIIEFTLNASIVKTNGNASDFYKAFPSQKKVIKAFIKVKNLKLKKETDLVALSNYVASII